MSHTVTMSISTSGARTERAFAALYRETRRNEQRKRRSFVQPDVMLTIGNAATWAYTIVSLSSHL